MESITGSAFQGKSPGGGQHHNSGGQHHHIMQYSNELPNRGEIVLFDRS